MNRTDAKRKKIKPVMWDDYEAFVIPNISREKWVSYHTDLGSHEAFLMTYVHSKLITAWTEKQRFLAIFVFRAHCRKEVFDFGTIRADAVCRFLGTAIDGFSV